MLSTGYIRGGSSNVSYYSQELSLIGNDRQATAQWVVGVGLGLAVGQRDGMRGRTPTVRRQDEW